MQKMLSALGGLLSIGMALTLTGCAHSTQSGAPSAAGNAPAASAGAPAAGGAPATAVGRPDATKIQAQIAKVNSDPNLPSDQKKRLLNELNYGLSMSARGAVR